MSLTLTFITTDLFRGGCIQTASPPQLNERHVDFRLGLCVIQSCITVIMTYLLHFKLVISDKWYIISCNLQSFEFWKRVRWNMRTIWTLPQSVFYPGVEWTFLLTLCTSSLYIFSNFKSDLFGINFINIYHTCLHLIVSVELEIDCFNYISRNLESVKAKGSTLPLRCELYNCICC
jgi:hypothetical protein